jgi:hypothetical protein
MMEHGGHHARGQPAQTGRTLLSASRSGCSFSQSSSTTSYAQFSFWDIRTWPEKHDR